VNEEAVEQVAAGVIQDQALLVTLQGKALEPPPRCSIEVQAVAAGDALALEYGVAPAA
jgi:hypothetical protein